MSDTPRKKSVALALGSLAVGVAATPVVAFVSIVGGIMMYMLSLMMIYRAS